LEGSREIPAAEEEAREEAREVWTVRPAGRPSVLAPGFGCLVFGCVLLRWWFVTADMRPRSMVAGAAGVSWCAVRASPWICVFPA
jgi:hypothetical protein